MRGSIAIQAATTAVGDAPQSAVSAERATLSLGTTVVIDDDNMENEVGTANGDHQVT